MHTTEEADFRQGYLFDSRPLTHISFWVGYYLLFSLIWAKPEHGYFASFYLEFILLPVRILAVYCMLYWLIPNMLVTRQYKQFVFTYACLILIAGVLQRVIDYFFYQQLLLSNESQLIDIAGWLRSIILINTTVVLLAAAKIFKLYLAKQHQVDMLEAALNAQQSNTNQIIELKSNRRTHKVKADQIAYLEAMGNYVNYYLTTGEKIVVYSSIKAGLAQLPEAFIRLHRSYVINTNHIESYSNDNVTINGVTLPRGSDISDEVLSPIVS